MHIDKMSLKLKEEKGLTNKVAKSDSFEDLGKIIFNLNEKYRIKGEYESGISQIEETGKNIHTINTQIGTIDNYLNSGNFENILKK